MRDGTEKFSGFQEGEGYSPMWTKVDKGRESIFTVVLRTSFMDDPSFSALANTSINISINQLGQYAAVLITRAEIANSSRL